MSESNNPDVFLPGMCAVEYLWDLFGLMEKYFVQNMGDCILSVEI